MDSEAVRSGSWPERLDRWRYWFTGDNAAASDSMAMVGLSLGMTVIAAGWVVAPVGVWRGLRGLGRWAGSGGMSGGLAASLVGVVLHLGVLALNIWLFFLLGPYGDTALDHTPW